jgi:hypothetical protein
MDNDVRTHPQEQIGKPPGAELETHGLDLRGKSVAEIASILASPPIRCEDGTDDPLSHTPPVESALPPVVPEPFSLTNAPSIIPRIVELPPMAPGIGCPNVDLKPLKSRPFKVVTRFGRLSFAVILAAIVGIGVILMTFPNEVRRQAGDISLMVTPLFEGSSRARISTKLPRLVVKGIRGTVNEPLPLGVSLTDVPGGDRIILAGLPIGTSLSTGTPLGLTGWQMLARDVGNALVYAPKDYVGSMVAAIDLRSAGDWLLDSKTVRLEWIQKTKASGAPLRTEP